MTLQTAGLIDDPYTQADIAPDPGTVRGAVVEQAFSDLVGPSILRGSELSTARKYGGLAHGNLAPDQARAWVAEQGLAEFLPLEDRTYNPQELAIIARRKREELRRQAILARAPQTAGATLGRFGLSLATSLVDPLTVASAFVPVVGEAKYAQLLARAGGLGGRTAVRAGVGAAEGAAGAALVEPIIYQAKREELADYTLADSLLNIGLGTVFGGGLHAVGGAISDRLTLRDRIGEKLAEVERATVAPEAAPDTPAIDPRQYIARREAGGPDEYFRQADALKRLLDAVPEFDTNDPRAVGRFLGEKTPSLSQFVRETGGITDEGGELAARDVTAKDQPGLIRKAGTPDAGMDAVRERVWEAGYFPEKADYNDISDTELLDAITADVRGERRYTNAVQERLNRLRDDYEFADSMRRDGITKGMSTEEIARHLRDMDDEIGALTSRDDPDVDTLAEYDRAADLADVAGPDAREAALRAGVAQAVTGRPIDVEGLLRRDPAAVRRTAEPDPDRAPLADPDAVRRVDETLAEGDAAEPTAVEARIAELDEEVRALEAEAKADEAEDVFPADLREELDAAAEAANEATLIDRAGRMLAACAVRFG